MTEVSRFDLMDCLHTLDTKRLHLIFLVPTNNQCKMMLSEFFPHYVKLQKTCCGNLHL